MREKIYSLSKRIGKSLRKKNLTLAVAESCTGGLFSSLITDIPGSSKYFILGIIAYNKSQKEKFLKIPKIILKRYSPVSEEVSKLMAENIRKVASSDIGIGITGYAGPKGGSRQNPKGTVYIAVSFKDETKVEKYLFKGKRTTVKYKAVYASLRLLNKILLGRINKV